MDDKTNFFSPPQFKYKRIKGGKHTKEAMFKLNILENVPKLVKIGSMCHGVNRSMIRDINE